MSRQTLFTDEWGVAGLRGWVWAVIGIALCIAVVVVVASVAPTVDSHVGFKALDCETMKEIITNMDSHEHHLQIFAEQCL